MSMVDRYKKSGGFIQLLQVIEICGLKKREQFMSIITEESPNWADALNQKCLTYDKIISWKPEILLEVIASVNMLSFSTALKGLTSEQLSLFLNKFSHQDKSRLERTLQDINPSPAEISSSMMKVISETRNLLSTGSLKADKIDSQLVIPDDYEIMLEKNQSVTVSSSVNSSAAVGGVSVNDIVAAALNLNNSSGAGGSAEIEKLQKKLILLTKEIQNLKQENIVMKDKLEKIKKIA
jgi:hypothetical protein